MLFSELLEYAQKAQIAFEYRYANSKEIYSNTSPTKYDFTLNNSWADSREVKENDIFICIQGENSDGHNYINQAVANNASLVIADICKINEIDNFSTTILFLNDPEKDIMRIAHAKRMAFQGRVIGITGSAGKTTVKEILAQILAHKGQVAKNHKNYNTQLGLSLSILNAANTEDYWVLEAGISREHDMDEIAEILRPNIALILNAGLAHAEGLPRGAAYYKSKLFKYLHSSNSLAFASADYSDLLIEAKKNCESVRFFSIKDSLAHYSAKYIGKSKENISHGMFELKINNNTFSLEVPFFGDYGAENVVAISSLALACGMTIEEIQNAFVHVVLPAQRFEVHTIGDITLIDDSYNANPLSFERMISAASVYTSKDKPLVCLIGSMGELGEVASEAHKVLGSQAAENAEYIFYTGNFQNEFKIGLNSKLANKNLSILPKPENFTQALDTLSLSSAVFLVKGSRVHALEEYVKIIQSYYEAKYAL